jgi:hypothetical protein
MADYIDNFHNVERRHSYLGNISPTEFETLWTSTYPIPCRLPAGRGHFGAGFAMIMGPPVCH